MRKRVCPKSSFKAWQWRKLVNVFWVCIMLILVSVGPVILQCCGELKRQLGSPSIFSVYTSPVYLNCLLIPESFKCRNLSWYSHGTYSWYRAFLSDILRVFSVTHSKWVVIINVFPEQNGMSLPYQLQQPQSWQCFTRTLPCCEQLFKCWRGLMVYTDLPVFWPLSALE